MSDTSQGDGWWQASDGKWYAPEQHPDYRPPPPPVLQRPSADFLAWVNSAGPYVKQVSAATGRLSAMSKTQHPAAIVEAANNLIAEIDAAAQGLHPPVDPTAAQLWGEWLILMRASGEETIRAAEETHDLAEAARLSGAATERMHQLVRMSKPASTD